MEKSRGDKNWANIFKIKGFKNLSKNVKTEKCSPNPILQGNRHLKNLNLAICVTPAFLHSKNTGSTIRF